MDPIYVSLGPVPAALDEECASEELKAVDVAGRRMILARVGDTYRVFARECPHEWADLLDGVIDGGVVVCSQHGYEFDLATGECVTPLVWCSALNVLPTEIRDGQIFVRLEVPAP